MAKIGILGGTFDPIHKGHIALAESAKEQFSFDNVYLIPSSISYMKKGVTGTKCRLNMVKLAVSENSDIKVSEIEIKKGGDSYTCETLRELKQNLGDDIYYIIGADTLFMIEKWKEPQAIFSLCTIIVASRDGYTEGEMRNQAQLLKEKYQAVINFMDFKPFDISSSQIRREIEEGKEISTYVDVKVNKYIKEHHLYGYEQDKFCKLITSKLSSKLKPKRFQHTLNVSETMMNLADIYGEDVYKAQIAGLLHDCAKYMSGEEMIEICENNAIQITTSEYANQELLHAKVGAFLAQHEYGISDDIILDAIIYHTTGRPEMTLMDKLLYVSDYIEPGRDFSDRLPMLRILAKQDIDLILYTILSDALNHLKTKKCVIDERTEQTLNFYENYLKENNKLCQKIW